MSEEIVELDRKLERQLQWASSNDSKEQIDFRTQKQKKEEEKRLKRLRKLEAKKERKLAS